MNDLTSSMAPTSKVHASAISPMSSVRVSVRAARVSVPPRSLTRSELSAFTRVPIHAGRSPAASVAAAPDKEVTASARTSMFSGLSVRGRKASGRNARANDTSIQPTAIPTPMPNAPSAELSTSAWRINRGRDAPSAARMLNSR